MGNAKMQTQINEKQTQNYKNIELIPTFEMQLINDDLCYCFTFNTDSTILACGFNKKIILFNSVNGDFNNSPLTLVKHLSVVNCITFNNKSNWFASCDSYGILIGWKEYKNNWIPNILLNDTDYALCQQINYLILNQSEDQLISSGWNYFNTWKVNCNDNMIAHLQSFNDENYLIYGCILNSKNDILITSTGKSISMWKKDSNENKWEKIYFQQMKYESHRLCFINHEEFVLEWDQQSILQIFKVKGDKFIHQSRLPFNVDEPIHVCYLFLMKYNKQKKLLFNKQETQINFFERKDNGKFVIKKTIDCNSVGTEGVISNNFEYIVYLDGVQQKIKFFKINYR